MEGVCARAVCIWECVCECVCKRVCVSVYVRVCRRVSLYSVRERARQKHPAERERELASYLGINLGRPCDPGIK